MARIAFLMVLGSSFHISITTAKSGGGGNFEHNRLCSYCADIMLVVFPGCDRCKAFFDRYSTEGAFATSCGCPVCDSFCPGFGGFCPDVNCVEMVEAAGIEPASRGMSVYASTCVSGVFKVRKVGLPPAGYASSLDRQKVSRCCYRSLQLG